MKSRNIFLAAFILITVAAIAGCSAAARSAGQPINGSAAGGAPTSSPAATSISNVTTEVATATPSTGYIPIATRDVISELVTQAYSQVTPATPTPQPPAATATAASTSIVPANIALLLTPTATHDPVPASVIFSEPILISNAVNTADCKIRDSSGCTPSMSAGETLFFTWRFGVQGAETFDWGQAAVVINRNGQFFKWAQVGDGLVQPPDNDESWALNVGQTAEFRAGLENAQPGYYTARLLMCTLSAAECKQGQGWQNVGGEAINFVITPQG